VGRVLTCGDSIHLSTPQNINGSQSKQKDRQHQAAHGAPWRADSTRSDLQCIRHMSMHFRSMGVAQATWHVKKIRRPGLGRMAWTCDRQDQTPGNDTVSTVGASYIPQLMDGYPDKQRQEPPELLVKYLIPTCQVSLLVLPAAGGLLSRSRSCQNSTPPPARVDINPH
jgi:hypothetical protein